MGVGSSNLPAPTIFTKIAGTGPQTVTTPSLDPRDAQGSLEKLSGLELSGEKVSGIKCYLTGERLESGEFSIRRLEIKDKHGLSRIAYNAKVNIYREHAQPILLGIEDRKLAEFRPAH